MHKIILGAVAICSSMVWANSNNSRKAYDGDIQSLMNTVVDIIVPDKDTDNSKTRKISDGAGFIIHESGYIVTNCHVIENVEKIKVVIYDGTAYTATVIGKDDRSDIALLKIDTKKKLPVISWGDSDKVEVCDRVLAIGNPFGFGKTVTAGIISYKNRNLSNQIAEIGANGDLVSYLQTDAAINHGNSGGPLFSVSGQLIGMMTIFWGDDIHSTGINFAIPSNTVKKVAEQLKNYGHMQRSWLGINAEPLERDVAIALGLDNIGYSIKSVEPNSPAHRACLQAGDVIIALNNEAISEDTNFEYLLNNLPIGEVIPIKVLKQGGITTFSVTVEAKQDVESAKETQESCPELKYELIDGTAIGVAELTNELRNFFNIPSSVDGVIVGYVGDSSLLSVGDVITRIGQASVSSVSDVKAKMKSLPQTRNTVAFYVFYPQESSPDREEFRYVSVNISGQNARHKVKEMIKKIARRAGTTKR